MKKCIINFLLLYIDLQSASGFLWSEKCPDDGIPTTETDLESRLANHLFGQPFVVRSIPKIIKTHLRNNNPPKPLVLSFQGSIGTGKTLTAEAIAQYVYPEYQNNGKSEHVHFIDCRKYKNYNYVEDYKREIRKLIADQTRRCPRSLYIFHNFAGIPHNVLDPASFTRAPKSIFIFESDIGCCNSVGIGSYMVRRPTLSREEVCEKDHLPSMLSNICVESDMVSMCGIVSEFIPFLPLNHTHTRQCVLQELCRRDGFRCSGKSLEVIHAIDDIVSFEKDDANFADFGCRGIDSLVNKYYHDNSI